ncbi:MAG TPA: class I SAM-dependent methyltransferase [Thermoanaerobaculia bacterium]|nr:class I SAM-dependent methyltransferase [Thermoanaerobaculia bacterium]
MPERQTAIATGERPDPVLDDFLSEPTRDLADWRWLWKGDREFPVRSHRGLWGRLLVAVKRLVRPLVKVPQNDLWERQRVFNLILLEHLKRGEELREDLRAIHNDRLAYLEGLAFEGITELMHHNDALFSRVDQKLDLYRREARNLLASLSSSLAVLESKAIDQETIPDAPPKPAGGAVPRAPARAVERDTEPRQDPPPIAVSPPVDAPPADTLIRARQEHAYFELERRYRGTEEEIAERISRYLPYFEGKKQGRVLDLGCGRGEALALLQGRGVQVSGVDSSARMVALCRQRGLEAEEGDLLEVLAAVPAASLGGVVSFHVIEHLPPESLDRLVRLAWRALLPGGVLILETPNPLSVVVAARNFWLDPTHLRPVHPDSLRLLYELAGFDPVERLDLRPFPDAERLPEIDLAPLPAEQRPLADRVNRLRDRLDELLFGFQDYGMVGTKPN